MTDIVLHPVTQESVRQFLSHPASAVAITGPSGVGKSTVAHHLARNILQLSAETYGHYPYTRQIEPAEGKAISIDAIRELQSFLSLRIPGGRKIARVIIIDQAHLLTPEAQNALLKTLEEPPEDSVVLLTTSYLEALLPTVRSRISTLSVIVPAATDVCSYYKARGFETALIDKNLPLSGGLPGVLAALLESQEEHPLYQATATARRLLGSRQFERLLLAEALSKQKQQALDVLFMLGQMARASLLSGTKSADDERRWTNIMKESDTAMAQLRQNAQTKLVLTNLMLEI